MKKSYTKKRKGSRTTIALNPEMTKRIDKILGDQKLSKFAIEVLDKELKTLEMKQAIERYEKLGESGQYHKIKRLEEDLNEYKNKTDSLLEFQTAWIEEIEIGKKLDEIDSKLGKLKNNTNAYLKLKNNRKKLNHSYLLAEEKHQTAFGKLMKSLMKK